jgi:hypothetical protein
MNENENSILRIDVTGKDSDRWRKLKSKLFNAIDQLLDSTIDHERNTTVREEVKQFTSAALDYARQRLAKQGLENDRIEAEVFQLYAERERTLAEARKINAEADEQELQTRVKKLRLILSATKIILISEPGEEAILFGKEIDRFLQALNEEFGREKQLFP